MRSWRAALVIGIAALSGLAACSGQISDDGITTGPFASATAGATQTAAASEPHVSASAPTSPSPQSSPLTLGWEQIGTIDTHGTGTQISGRLPMLLGFQAGYAAIIDKAVVHTSVDGINWRLAALAASSCRSGDIVFLPSLHAAVTDGRHILLVGSDVRDCYDEMPAAWITSDGENWEHSVEMPRRHGALVAAWPTFEGWEAVLWAGGDGGLAIWRSTDGVRWREIALIEIGDLRLDLLAAGIGPDGTRLMSVSAIGPGARHAGSAVLVSADGKNWRPVQGLADGRSAGTHPYDISSGAAVVEIAPPTADRPGSWVVLTRSPLYDSPAVNGLLMSADSVNWERAVLPDESLIYYGLTSLGDRVVMAATEPTNSEEAAPGWTVYLGAEMATALDWASVTPRLDNEQPPEFGRSSFFAVAYGSSGFIAIDGDTDPRVLRLVP